MMLVALLVSWGCLRRELIHHIIGISKWQYSAIFMRHIQKMQTDRLTVSAAELAKMLGLGRQTIYRLAAERRIPCTEVGRRKLFSVDAIRKWLEENSTGPAH